MSQNESSPPKNPGGLAIIKKYSEASSIKCLPKFFKAKHWLQRTLWLSTLASGAAFASFQLWGLLDTYLSYTTSTSTKRTTEGRVFPDVTLCNLNYMWNTGYGGLKARVHGYDRNLSYSEYIALMNDLSWTYLENGNAEYYQYIQSDPYTISGFVRHLPDGSEGMWDSLSPWLVWECLWEDTDRIRHNCSTVKHFLSPDNGICYTISLQGVDVDTMTGMSVIVYLNTKETDVIYDYYLSPVVSYATGVKVAFSPPGSAPDMHNALMLSPGHQATVKAELIERVQLTEPYGICTTDMDFAILPTIPHPQWNYSKYACKDLCLQESIIKTCGCISSFHLSYSKLRSRHHFCGIMDITRIESGIEEIRCAHKVAKESNVACNWKCPHSCRSINYETKMEETMWPNHGSKLSFYHQYIHDYTGDLEFDDFYQRVHEVETSPTRLLATLRASDVIERNFLQLNVLLQEQVSVVEDTPALTIETMFGSTGGILNLWVGLTFVTLAEIIDCVGVLLVNLGRSWGRGGSVRGTHGVTEVSKF